MQQTELVPTWVVVNIGNRKYAINQAYVQSIQNITAESFKEQYIGSSFVKGIYNIHDVIVNIIDGRRVTGAVSIDDEKMQMVESINDIISDHKSWLNAIEWEVLTGEKPDFEYSKDLKILDFLKECEESNTKSITDITKKISNSYKTVHNLAEKTLDLRRKGEKTLSLSGNLSLMSSESDKYIVKNLQKLIDIKSSQFVEMVVVIKAHGVSFGISVDSIQLITETNSKLNKSADNFLSAGKIKLQDKWYNILDLTKLYRVFK